MCRPARCDRLLLALALGALTSGCGKFREVSACRSIAREVNTALDEIEPLSRARPMDEPRIAKRYATLAQSLQPHTVGETPLALAVRDYVSVLQATDLAVRNHTQALTTQSGKLNDPRRELERLMKRERAAVTRIEVECEH